jgi:bifunctional non-homologous end joining protein LigD
VHGDAGLLELGGDPLQLLAGAVAGHRLAVAGELLGAHLPHAGPGAQALDRELDVARVADHRPDVRLVWRLVTAEPHVTVRTEDLGLTELGGELVGELGHRAQHLVLVDRLVRGPVALGVLGRQAVVEIQRLLGPPAERHARLPSRFPSAGRPLLAAPSRRSNQIFPNEQWQFVRGTGYTGSMDTPEREGVELTHLDQPLFDGADATKRDLVDYLDACSSFILPELQERPLSVIRVRGGQQPFMQKNVPDYAPSWIRTVSMWAQASKREVHYALCDDRRTLLWFANQRAVEYHPTLFRVEAMDRPTYLILDIDPPSGGEFGHAVAAALLVRRALADVGLTGAVKTSGSKGVHIYVPIIASADDAAAATRAIAVRAEKLDPALATTAFVKDEREGKVFLDSTRAHGATVAAAYSPRARPGATVSFPVRWEDLESVTPRDFTVKSAPALLDGHPAWAGQMPAPQELSGSLVQEGHEVPVARVQAMHEGKRRARARRSST